MNQLEAMQCPSCGAPIRFSSGQSLALCLYCQSTIRLETGESGQAPTASVQAKLSEEEMAEVRGLLLQGQRGEALQRYQAASGLIDREAEAAIADLTRQIAWSTIRSQQLTLFGIFLVAISLVIFLACAWAMVTGAVHPALALLMGAFSAATLYNFREAVRTTLRYQGASTAPATTLKLAPIGVFHLRGGDVHTFKVWLEVRPPGGEPFEAEMRLPVRARNLERAKAGAVIQVKYLPGDPESVIYHGKD